MALFHVSVNDERVKARLLFLPRKIKEKLRASIAGATQRVEARVKQKLSGEVLNLKSGMLRASIYSLVKEGTFTVTGTVASSESVPYARIQEFGGIIRHPGSLKLQAWDELLGAARSENIPGRVFTHRTRPHDIKIPERSYLRSTFLEMANGIKSEIKAAVRAGVKE